MASAGDAPSAAPRVVIDVPSWVEPATRSRQVYGTDDEKMALVIDLARENVDRRTGGPVGAAVFAESYASLAERGVTFVRDVKRAESASIIRASRDAGGPIYNARSPPGPPGPG